MSYILTHGDKYIFITQKTMASACNVIQNAFSPSISSPKRYYQNNPSLFSSPKSILRLKKQTLLPSSIEIKPPKISKIRTFPIVYAAQANFFKVVRTAYKVGRDGIEAGTNLVPSAVPRPLARVFVSVAALTSALFVLKSFLSTAFFALAVMGLSYLTFMALNKDEATKGYGGTNSSSVDDSIEEARRIMEKYK